MGYQHMLQMTASIFLRVGKGVKGWLTGAKESVELMAVGSSKLVK